ncbi:MAG: hypothetical protein WEA28_13670, partial [Xanthobacteraceae bacterium]
MAEIAALVARSPYALQERDPIAAVGAFARFGRTFRIWVPRRFRARLEEAASRPRAWRGRLGSESAA